MKKHYVGTMVAYEKETKEWQIVKAELVQGEHTDDQVEYTIRKVIGQNLGQEKVLDGEAFND